GVVPRNQLDSALLLDVGSGNTKGGYRDAGTGRYVTLDIPYGVVTFTDLVAKEKKEEPESSFAELAADLRGQVLTPVLKRQLAANPGLRQRDRVYLSGGVAWATATLTHPGERGAFVELTLADLDRLQAMLKERPDALSAADLSSVKDEKARREAEADL